MPNPAPNRRAKIYDRPRFGVRLTPQLWLSLAGFALSCGITAWWAYRHWHHAG